MAVQTQIQTRRGTAASWTSTNPTLAAGEFGYETDTGKFKIGNGSTAWASLAYTAAATAVTYLFNATSGQTTFSGADANGLTLAYTVGAEQVYLNGVLQVRGSDYTATNGTSIVLTSGALTSDVLNVIAYSAMTVTDTYTQAQADAKFFQTANAFLAGKNKIINGDFGVWQRGTSFTNPGTTFCADRFNSEDSYSASGNTVTRQTFTPGTAPVAGYEGSYFWRTTLPSSGTFTQMAICQRVEDVRTLAGQTATFSFWAKSSIASTVGVLIQQRFGSGGSATVNTNFNTTVNLTTSWQRFTVTATMNSVSGKTIGDGSSLYVYLYTNSGMSASQTYDTWGWQVEAGSIATPFQTATGTIAGELAACQRYYQRAVGTTGAFAAAAITGIATNSTTVEMTYAAPVQFRIAPTIIDVSGMAVQGPGGGLIGSPSSITIDSAVTNTNTVGITFNKSAAFVTSGFYRLLKNNNVNEYIAFGAEL